MGDLVRLDTADGVATITLDSQHNRNALSRQLVGELGDAGLAEMGFETPLFTGRAMAGLTADSHLLEKAGKRQRTWDLALEYGFTDKDGSVPNSHSYLENE